MEFNDMMINLVTTICAELVDHPENLTVDLVEKDNGTATVEIRAHQDDMGKIIGKQGRIAKAIRTVVKAAAIKSDKKVFVEIVE